MNGFLVALRSSIDEYSIALCESKEEDERIVQKVSANPKQAISVRRSTSFNLATALHSG